jgi:hypothetical protein
MFSPKPVRIGSARSRGRTRRRKPDDPFHAKAIRRGYVLLRYAVTVFQEPSRARTDRLFGSPVKLISGTLFDIASH